MYFFYWGLCNVPFIELWPWETQLLNWLSTISSGTSSAQGLHAIRHAFLATSKIVSQRIPDPEDPFFLKFYKVDSADFYKTQHCKTHKRECLLFPEHQGEKSDLETAGLPCWDMSLAGKRLQENGRTVGTFLCHAKRHIELMTPIIIVENTKDRIIIGTNQTILIVCF